MKDKRRIYKLFLGALFLVGVSSLCQAARKPKGVYQKRDTWEETMVASRNALLKSQASSSFKPAESPVMRKGNPANKMVVDVTGLKRIYLISWGTKDGNSQDHAVWANARLIDTKGNAFFLDDLEFVSATTGWGPVSIGHNYNGKPFKIGKKEYNKGIEVHANGQVCYNLNGKYVRFEAEVGIDKDANRKGSVIFQVRDITTDGLMGDVAKDFPRQMGYFSNFGKGLSYSWFSGHDLLAGKKLVEGVLARLDEPAYLRGQMEKVLESGKETELLKFFLRTCQVYDMQELLKQIDLEAIRLSIEHIKKSAPSYKGDVYLSTLSAYKEHFPQLKEDLYKGDPKAIKTFENFMAFRRQALLANPLLDFDKILAVRHYVGDRARRVMADSFGTPRNNWTTHTAIRHPDKGWNNEIVVLSNLRGEVKSETLYKPETTKVVNDLDLNWDGERVLFSSVGENKRWHLFELDVNTKDIKQLSPSDKEDIDYFDGCYLPNGKIAYVSNAAYQGIPCIGGGHSTGSVFLLDPEKKDIRQLNFGQDNDWHPVVTNSGRVMYLRWEYTDEAHYFTRILMHMNPDGTAKKEYYGSGSYFPNSMFYARPIPNHPTKFVTIVSGHHGTCRSGRLMIFDPAQGRKEAEGVVQEIPGRGKKVEPVIMDRLVDGVWPQFLMPYPLSEDYFLVVCKPSPTALWGLYLADTYDNLVLIKEFEDGAVVDPIPLRTSKKPPVIPEKVNVKSKEATVFISDIYEGPGLKGVARGTVKNLRIFAYHFAYNNTGGHDLFGMESSWDVKRILGTVPVEEDGSAIFKIPANTPVAIQPLDSEGRAMQLMRSWFVGMPGEFVSCVGCHEPQNMLPPAKFTTASRKRPEGITPWYGPARPFSYENEVQPVLDSKCVACHNGKSGIPDFTDKTKTKYRGFSGSYMALQRYVRRPGPESDQHVLAPMEYHASSSELVQMLTKGHHNVKLSKEEWDRLYTWIDLNIPYHNKFAVPEHRGYEQEERREELACEFANVSNSFTRELNIADSLRKARGVISPIMPKKPKSGKCKKVKARKWPFDEKVATEKQEEYGEKVKSIDLGNGIKMELVRIPAGEFVMGDNNGDADERPQARVKIKNAYWMGRFEVTNEQFGQFFPEHDSRYIDQFWKDHTRPGYDANRPQQPVIRISWNEALAFCEKLKEKTGLNFTLPTEAQWEWACRAGSAEAMWYGTMTSDFASYANLADEKLRDFAVVGVDPKPMSKNHWLRPYYDFIPKANGVDDGQLIGVEVGTYKPNVWGLYDMIGNVAEWTRSDYVSYPYTEKDGRNNGDAAIQKTVRGGSWRDRPQRSTASFRLGYEPWQKVYNVGFRVVFEEEE